MSKRIAIIGAGIGGLTLGIELQHRGLDVQLYEQTSVLREVGAAVSLSANATRFYDHRFGLAEPLGAVSAEVDGLIFRDGRTGERIARLSSHDEYRRRFGASFLGIHRAGLQAILFGALDPESLHLSKHVTQIDDSGDAAVLHFADGDAPVVEMVTAVPVTERWALFFRPPLTHWSDGRITLLGDAAHATVPHHGQGANQSIEDAIVLSDLLAGSDDWDAARLEYERRRRFRTRRVVDASVAVGEMLHLPDGPRADERNARLAAPGAFDRHLAWVHGFRAGDDLHISGLVSFASDGTIVGEGDIDVQVEQVFTKMRAVVEEAGGSMDDIVSPTTYLTDVTQAPSISAARARHFTGDVLPTHTVIGVAALARPQFLVEISAIAHLG
ncbi:Rid family hydrolase [Kocuria palustris]|uniref:Rid family hydrolase n=1 Tax=Kocuria palustris TaxID=71999 RepID=UPI0021A5771E|nr:Rid family hydrolase [Kocuria palustris]MCT1589464.1 Rid family hydrolase [Kocuria palustris]